MIRSSIDSDKPVWRHVIARLTRLTFGRSSPEVLTLPDKLREDVDGLPGDVPSDVPSAMSSISKLLEQIAVPWCVVGDLLLEYYSVPKIIADIEVCILSEDLEQVREAFSDLEGFCVPFRPRASTYSEHLTPFPRFKVKGMNLCFFLVPNSHYGLPGKALINTIRSPKAGFPILPLPYYLRGLSRISAAHSMRKNSLSFNIQIEYLIDGMDVDEAWCHKYLDGAGQLFVLQRSTRVAKKARMGPLPKYQGNITTYLHTESERQQVLDIMGRDMDIEGKSIFVYSVEKLTQPNTEHTLPIQIMSDLHLELPFRSPEGDSPPQSGYDIFECKPSAPILALLGDTGLVSQKGLFTFLRRQLLKYEKIMFIMGNHEYYGSSCNSAKVKMREFSDEIKEQRSLGVNQGEFIFLDQTRYDLSDEITILGCTLWSHIPTNASETVGSRLKDFKRISEWSIERHNEEHLSDANWLESTCGALKAESPNRRIIIFTHHAPLLQRTSSPSHLNGLINTAFATDMTIRSCWGSPVSLWVFGHTHFSCDFVHGDIRVVSNPRGYEIVDATRCQFVENLILHV